MTAPTRAAYYYPFSKAQRANLHAGGAYELHELTDGRRRVLLVAHVEGLTEARQRAEADNATPWNF